MISLNAYIFVFLPVLAIIFTSFFGWILHRKTKYLDEILEDAHSKAFMFGYANTWSLDRTDLVEKAYFEVDDHGEETLVSTRTDSDFTIKNVVSTALDFKTYSSKVSKVEDAEDAAEKIIRQSKI